MTLPNFFLAGAPKAGTTSLYNYLNQHPDIVFSSEKEPQFFNLKYKSGIEWYEQTYFAHCTGSEKRIGDGTVWTMKCPTALQRIAQHVPNALFLYIMRNPIDRAFSEYQYYLMRGVWKPEITFSEVIRTHLKPQQILGEGRYYDHLVYFEELFDRSQVLPIFYEDLSKKRDETLKQIFDFLDVASDFVPQDTKRHNVTAVPRNIGLYALVHRSVRPIKNALESTGVGWIKESSRKIRGAVRSQFFTQEVRPEMKPEDREYLREYYAEPNRQLAEYTGRDLSHWT